MKLKTKYWNDDTGDKRVKPFWAIATYSMVNTGYFIFADNTFWAIINIIFFLTGALAILSYNKWRKNEGLKNGGSTQNRQKEPSKKNKKPIQQIQ